MEHQIECMLYNYKHVLINTYINKYSEMYFAALKYSEKQQTQSELT